MVLLVCETWAYWSSPLRLPAHKPPAYSVHLALRQVGAYGDDETALPRGDLRARPAWELYAAHRRLRFLCAVSFAPDAGRSLQGGG